MTYIKEIKYRYMRHEMLNCVELYINTSKKPGLRNFHKWFESQIRVNGEFFYLQYGNKGDRNTSKALRLIEDWGLYES